MKKIIVILCLFAALLILIACGDTAETTIVETTTEVGDTEKPDAGTVGSALYTAVPNEFVWESAQDAVEFDIMGTGKYCVQQFDYSCNGYQKTYVYMDENNNEVISTKKELQSFEFAGAVVTKDDTAKVGKIVLYKTPCRVEPAWKSVSAKGGYYLTFEFVTNLSGKFAVSVTTRESGDFEDALDSNTDITVDGKDGKYVGIAKCNVPRVKNKTYYINIHIDDNSKYPVVASIPLTVTELWYEGPYTLVLTGDWQLIEDKTYFERLCELFYTVYPKQYARWGTGSEPKKVYFFADVTYDGIAKAGGEQVTIAVDYANEKPSDIGYFSHELMHIVQQYGARLNYSADEKDGYGGWFRENFASYGGFRYFHWGTDPNNVQIKDHKSQSVQNWGYEPYGDAVLFFAYMDANYPTTDKNGDGTITSDEYGLIDAIHFLIKNNSTNTMYYDTPTDKTSPIGKTVASVTDGKYTCIEDLRKAFEKECEDGTWQFIGYRDFKDNFLTEGISYLPAVKYPMLESATRGDKTATPLSAPVLEGDNLALNATPLRYSHATISKPIKNLLDGNLESFWMASEMEDYWFALSGITQGVVIDLGEVKSFNTYTMVCRGYDYSNKAQNAKEWEVLVSTDGVNFTSVDYQNGNKADAVSFHIGDVSARYIELRFYTPDQNNTDNLRMQEFMLFKQ